jgi:branched-chain amino acid transport system ATP-binding protein
MSDVLLQLNDICTGYGPTAVLEQVSLAVGVSEIVCLIGGNGAGKTTTLRSISGLLPPRSGTIIFAGTDITRLPPHRIVELGLAQVPEGRRIFARLSVLENLTLGAWLRSEKTAIGQDIERCFTLFPILAERRNQAGGTLSGGEQQMLAIARALMSRPRLLLMDEPSMGVAPLITARIFEAVKALNREGLAILLVEQNARMALAMATNGYVLETGRITVKGLAAHLANDERVRKAYLGG